MTIRLSQSFPKLLRDFFEHDTEINRRDNFSSYEELVDSDCGWFPIDLPFKVDLTRMLKEIKTLNHSQGLMSNLMLHGNDVYNIRKSDPRLTQKETLTDLKQEWKVDLSSTPVLKKWCDQIGELLPLTKLDIKLMRPGGWFHIHCDPFSDNTGLRKLYFPVNWPDGCYFKMYRRGVIPMKPGQAMLLDVHHHLHTAVHTGTEDRYIINLSSNNWDNEKWKSVVESNLT